MEQPEANQHDRAAQTNGSRAQPPAVDVQQLADRVYRLMLAELRLEQARGARPGQRRKR